VTHTARMTEGQGAIRVDDQVLVRGGDKDLPRVQPVLLLGLFDPQSGPPGKDFGQVTPVMRGQVLHHDEGCREGGWQRGQVFTKSLLPARRSRQPYHPQTTDGVRPARCGVSLPHGRTPTRNERRAMAPSACEITAVPLVMMFAEPGGYPPDETAAAARPR
jgi:hypothetical protein